LTLCRPVPIILASFLRCPLSMSLVRIARPPGAT
jgi:hypothetical protein